MALGSRKKPMTTRGSTTLERRAGEPADRKVVSARHESVTASALGGEVQRGSGATERHKGDVKTPVLLVENKTRLPDAKDGAKSLTVKGTWLEKITREAVAIGRDPALAFEIPGIVDPLVEKRWVAVPESVMARLLESAG
jgi:hypothetical protein